MAEAQTERRVGVAVPLGALRGERSIGVGEFPDLAEFGGLCARMGVGLIQLLPVNDTGTWSAPYFALTAYALHPLYLRIGDLPEAEGGAYLDKLRDLKNKFDGSVRFPYEAILNAKMALLREIYGAHEQEIAARAAPGKTLGAWVAANPWVREYAVYRRLKALNHERGWQEWDNCRRVGPSEIEALWNDGSLKREHLFWAWLQEALDKQFTKAAAAVASHGILLEGDLPILMNEDSCDVWAHRDIFDLTLSAGAPPDQYSADGQNWGFPLYDWKAQAKDGYAWWKGRLRTAGKYYQAYRIDHVLGFFRIWATRREDRSAALGRYVPQVPILAKELADLGFDEGRVRWMSQPHVPSGEVWAPLSTAGLRNDDIERVFAAALTRIGAEELWLFKDTIHGEKDIEALKIPPAAVDCLKKAWANRLFLEFERGKFAPAWFYRESRAYASLTEAERTAIEDLIERKREESEKIWERDGKRLLKILKDASPMLACAEDLGAVPACVPRVLTSLKILGLRVTRWHRDWAAEGEPYIPLDAYPELSVCTPAVHDSSTVREWWETEADQERFAGFIGQPSLPRIYNPGAARAILTRLAGAASRFRVFQIQDLLHLSKTYYAPDAASERINVPGTLNDFNWAYRLPVPIAELARDEEWIKAVKELTTVKAPVKKPPAKKK